MSVLLGDDERAPREYAGKAGSVLATAALGLIILGTGYMACREMNSEPYKGGWVTYRMGVGTVWNSVDAGKCGCDKQALMRQIEERNKQTKKDFRAGKVKPGDLILMPEELVRDREGIVKDDVK